MRDFARGVMVVSLLCAAACSGADADPGSSDESAESAVMKQAPSPAWVAALKQDVQQHFGFKMGRDVTRSQIAPALRRRFDHIALMFGIEATPQVSELVLPAFPGKVATLIFFLRSGDRDVAIYDERGTFVAFGGSTEFDPFAWSTREP